MEPWLTLDWQAEDIGNGLLVDQNDVIEIFKDGRSSTPIIKMRLKRENPGWNLYPSANNHELLDPYNCRWKVRSITRHGVDFRLSRHIGIGRELNINTFQEELGGLNGYILADVVLFPSVPVYKVPIDLVFQWFEEGILNRIISRANTLYFLENT